MTDIKKYTDRRRIAAGRRILPVITAALTVILILDGGNARNAVLASLKLSATAVIPAILPCAVLAGVMTGMTDTSRRSRGLEGVTRFFFDLPSEAIIPIALGFLCGFPVGAKSVGELYLRGAVSKDEAERLICFCNLPSPAFVINAVGVGMLGSKVCGIALFAILLTLSLVAGILLSLPGRRQRNRGTVPNVCLQTAEDKKSLRLVLTDSVSSAASAMLRLCVYSAFFASLTALADPLVSILPPAVGAAVAALLELSGGCAASAETGAASLPLTAFALGWTGLAVHCQIMSVSPRELSLGKYFATSAIRGLTAFLIMLLVNLARFDIY